MPSVSKKQQKFMGIVRSIQKGEQPASKFSKSAQDAAKKMKKKDVEKYAKTKHKNLPSKVRQEIEEYVDGIVDGIEQELMTKEGFASDAQRRAAFASGYKAKGKKKKKEGVKEGKFTKIMKAVRKGPKAGPWTFIISKNNKIKKQVSVKNIKEIPAYYEDLKKAYPNDKIGIEAKDGKIVYRESVNEGTCGYGIDGKIGEEPAGPNLMKKIKAISKDKEKKKLLKSKKVNERLNQSQAKTLLRQLGGNKFIMMTGAKQMSIGKNGLTMKIGRNSKSITHVAIDLDRGKDLYIMKFIRVRKGIPKVVKQYDGIYADNLNNIFEKETGLYTRL